MTGLVGWLVAQLDADEAVARAATGEVWAVENHSSRYSDGSTTVAWGVATDAPAPNHRGGVYDWTLAAVSVEFDRDYGAPEGGCEREADAAHIALHDPARVLADVAAKRAIVAEFEARDKDVDLMLGPNTRRQREWSGLHLAVRILATAYADRDGYDEAVGE